MGKKPVRARKRSSRSILEQAAVGHLMKTFSLSEKEARTVVRDFASEIRENKRITRELNKVLMQKVTKGGR